MEIQPKRNRLGRNDLKLREQNEIKNIWILNHYAVPPELGGGNRHYNFAKNLIVSGYKVKVFAASTIHNTDKNLIKDKTKYLCREFNNVPFIFLKACDYQGNGRRRIKNMIDYAKGLILVSKNFDKDKPDVIFASSVHPLTWISGYILSKRYHAKFIAEARDLWPWGLIAINGIKENGIIAKILYKIEKFIYKKSNKFVFTFPGGKDYIQNIGLDTAKVRYINNGVDIEEFNKNKEEYVFSDEDLDNNEAFKILFTGAIGRTNAIGHIIEAAEIIKKKGIKKIRFYIFGSGPEKQKLEKYISDNKIDIIKFKGSVDKKYIPSILSKANLNIFSLEHLPNLFKYGLSPNKMFDYFASGHPIVSNVECGYDMLEKYNCGITVQGGSAESLALGILKFYNMPKEEYSIYCSNALKAVQDFDFKILTEKLEKVILED